ncbi:MAG: hypothetical protein Q9162_007565 [Coniocarpon cinnabarinum]
MKEFLQGEGTAHNISKLIVRFLQFVLGLTVAGIYGNHVHSQSSHNQASDSSFIFAVVVGGLTCVTTIAYSIPKVKVYYCFFWDWMLVIFWLALFGKFAGLFLNRNANNPKASFQGTNTQQMKNAVWVDLISLSLWVITAAYGTWVFLRRRKMTRDVEFGGAQSDFEQVQEKPQVAKYVPQPPTPSLHASPVSPLRPEDMRGPLGAPPSPMSSLPPAIPYASKPRMLGAQ